MQASSTTRVAWALYVAAVVVVVAGPWGGPLNRLTIRLYVQFRYTWPIAPDWALPEHYGLLLNVLLFVPLGAALALLTTWPWWRVVLVAAVASTLVELLQLVLPRDADPWDVLTNTLGAAIGALVVRAMVAFREPVRSPSRPTG